MNYLPIASFLRLFVTKEIAKNFSVKWFQKVFGATDGYKGFSLVSSYRILLGYHLRDIDRDLPLLSQLKEKYGWLWRFGHEGMNGSTGPGDKLGPHHPHQHIYEEFKNKTRSWLQVCSIS